MSEQLLTILKLCLLALLYLFFFRVLRAVWAELRTPVPAAPAPAVARAAAAAAAAPPTAVPAMPTAPKEPTKRGRSGPPEELVVIEPTADAGQSFRIGDELTVGRATGCAISRPDDTYVSTLHARVFRTPEGEVKVEDLGSTNGTYVNRAKVGNAVALHRGDRLQVGNTALEAR
jgi:pSer/pThr/pTyr-binding forkhead associated (FHA) protein